MPTSYSSSIGSKNGKLAPNSCLREALKLREAGLSVFPILGTTKVPAAKVLPWRRDGNSRRRSWKPYQTRLPSLRRLHRWFSRPSSMAIVCGRGLEVIDIDVKNDDARRQLCDELLERLREQWRPFTNVPIIHTPSGGIHIYYRCDEIEGNQVLARTDNGDVFVETRGEGGYVVAPYGLARSRRSNPSGYSDRGAINLMYWDDPSVSRITAEQRQELFAIIREFDIWTPPKNDRPTVAVFNGDYEDADPSRPGSLFNRDGSSDVIFNGTEWDLLFTDGAGNEYWRRPGKTDWSHSAVLYSDGVLIVYSTDGSIAPLESHAESGRGYSKFAAYTLLQHDGDWSAAAAAVSKMGFNSAECYSYGDVDRRVAEICQSVAQNAPESPIEQKTEDKTVELEPPSVAATGDEKTDPMFAYLWQGMHGRYLSDSDRQRRIESTNEVLKYVPGDSFFTRYLQYVMPTTDAPIWFHLATSLSLAGHLINRRAWMVSGTDRYYPLLWAAIISKSGQRKSSALNPARSLLANDSDLRQTMIGDKFTFAALVKSHGIEYRNEDEEKPLPTLNEAINLCQQNEEGTHHYTSGVGYLQLSEIATLLAMMGKAHSDETKPSFTDWFDCPAFDKKETATQGKYLIYKPFFSIIGASTIEWLVQGCRAGDLEGGFLPRWLWFTNAKQDFTLSFRDRPDPEAKDALLADIYKIKQFSGEMTFCDAAMDAYHDWHQGFCADADDILKSCNARLAIYAQKIAMIYEATTTRQKAVSLSSCELACRLVDRLKADLVSLLESQLSFNETDRLCNKFLEMLRADGGSMEHSKALRNLHIASKVFKSDVVPTCVERGAVVINESPTATKPQIVYGLVS